MINRVAVDLKIAQHANALPPSVTFDQSEGLIRVHDRTCRKASGYLGNFSQVLVLFLAIIGKYF